MYLGMFRMEHDISKYIPGKNGLIKMFKVRITLWFFSLGSPETNSYIFMNILCNLVALKCLLYAYGTDYPELYSKKQWFLRQYLKGKGPTESRPKIAFTLKMQKFEAGIDRSWFYFFM